MGVTIHDLAFTPHWVETVAEWHHSEWLKGRASASDIESQRSFSKRVASLKAHFAANPIPTTFVALFNDTPIGSVSLVLYQFTKHHQPVEWLTNVFVVEGHRNRGIGAQLVEHACHFAASQGVKALRLYTRDQQAYYTRQGWQWSGSGKVQGNDVAILRRELLNG